MMIVVAADHAGYAMKEAIAAHLRQKGLCVEDVGTHSAESSNYAEYAIRMAERVAKDPGQVRGIGICGSGIGMSIVANKFKSIRAALCHDEFTIRMSRAHNDANVLCLGARVLQESEAKLFVDVWLATPFEGGRHQERIRVIDQFEKTHIVK